MTETYIIRFKDSDDGTTTARIELEISSVMTSIVNCMTGDSAKFLRDFMLSSGEVTIINKSDKESTDHETCEVTVAGETILKLEE